MDHRQLEYFLAVAEAGSITSAAESLHMTQPPLSLAIAKLERELGVRLLDRHARGARLTRAGEYLRATGTRLVEEERNVTETMRLLGKGLAGELRLGAGPIVYWTFLAERIARFADRHPDIRLTLTDPAPAELLGDLNRGSIEIGILACSEPQVLALDLAPDVQTSAVSTLPLRLAVPAGWAPLEPVVDVAELLNQTWILPSRVPRFAGLPEVVDAVFARVGRRPERIIEVPTPQTALPLIAAGVGVSVITERAADHVPAIRTHQVHGGWPPLQVTLVWPRHEDGMTPAARLFLQELRVSARAAQE